MPLRISPSVGARVAEGTSAPPSVATVAQPVALTLPMVAPRPARSPTDGLARPAPAPRSLLQRVLPDGAGVTIVINGTTTAFRTVAQAQAHLATQRSGSVQSIVFYGHGSPGSMAIGDEGLSATTVADMLRGRLAPNAQVELFGCNTAAVGATDFGAGVADAIFFGLSSLTRRLVYFSVPVLVGGADKAQMEAMWNEDMARDTSKLLPGARVTGFRTYAFPADRLVPGSRNMTPSDHVLARPVTYRDGVEVMDARRAR